VLNSTKPCPTEGSLASLIKDLEMLNVTTLNPLDLEHVRIIRERKEFDDNCRSINKNIKKDAKKQTKRICA
jgi:Mg-chelatase subunit ChlI